jgi:hypothetical protein
MPGIEEAPEDSEEVDSLALRGVAGNTRWESQHELHSIHMFSCIARPV